MVSRLYLALSRVYQIYVDSPESASYQTYETMKQQIFSQIEDEVDGSEVSEQLPLDLILTLCLPLAQDGLPSSSPVWLRFMDTAIDKESTLQQRDCVLLAQSMSLVDESGQEIDQGHSIVKKEFWKMILKKFTEKLNEHPGDLQVIGGICFALENTSQRWQLSDQFLMKLQREIKKQSSELQKPENIAFKQVIQAFYETKLQQEVFAK